MSIRRSTITHRTETRGTISLRGERGIDTNVYVGDVLLQNSIALRFELPFGHKEAWNLEADLEYQRSKSLFVIDVKSVRTPLEKATGEAVAPVEGLPTVALADNGKPTITIPSGVAAPTSLIVQPLVKGTGAVVEAGQTISVHYTGIIWDTGKQFDSSWDRGEPTAFEIGKGSVIAGWDEGLVGQTVGSQVLLVVPPDKGYGSAGTSDGGIKGTDTLVFVVDVLDAY